MAELPQHRGDPIDELPQPIVGLDFDLATDPENRDASSAFADLVQRIWNFLARSAPVAGCASAMFSTTDSDARVS